MQKQPATRVHRYVPVSIRVQRWEAWQKLLFRNRLFEIRFCQHCFSNDLTARKLCDGTGQRLHATFIRMDWLCPRNLFLSRHSDGSRCSFNLFSSPLFLPSLFCFQLVSFSTSSENVSFFSFFLFFLRALWEVILVVAICSEKFKVCVVGLICREKITSLAEKSDVI